ncbi:MAG: hypothetical protein Q8P59_04705, partial [Dehalococcoidia bacterium]|nr:hypothetical protein [Dehalococcoidia bacterium]
TSDINAVYSGTAQNNARSVKIQRGGRNNLNLVIKFEHFKDTPGTHVFKEIAEDGKPKVPQLYIKKGALPTPVPTTIEVTIQW